MTESTGSSFSVGKSLDTYEYFHLRFEIIIQVTSVQTSDLEFLL